MIKAIDLSGEWLFYMDAQKGDVLPIFNDTILLPNTTSFAQKGPINTAYEISHLTDTYKFEGYAWFQKEIKIPSDYTHKTIFLFLERTRVTTIWVDGKQIATQNSLSTPHLYNLSAYLSPGKHTLTIRVDNTNYPTKGGHLTSSDTQSNWNGITGAMELRIYENTYLNNIQVYPQIQDKSIFVKGEIIGQPIGSLRLSAKSFNGTYTHVTPPKSYTILKNTFTIQYSLGDDALLWDEYNPNLYELTTELSIEDYTVDTHLSTFGLREFKAIGDKFTINDRRTFLRGKHDGLIFPLTGFAPTSVDEWLKILNTAKSYGINHYRFHTCCPPEAAFEAADRLGIYMEPEIPFWGTITTEEDEGHNQQEQDYLIEEGFRILKTFANHPSFVMFSLGNELWGNPERIRTILAGYKAVDSRPLYVQGSNNFQFTPCILPEDDFYCGVRFSKDRLIRGSYAMCDAPLGIIQTDAPSTKKNFDEAIKPLSASNNSSTSTGDMIEIQFGTGTKTVKASDTDTSLIPHIPVVSHEVGQYQTFPNFEEISKYTGPLKARNFEVFKKHLEEKGLLDLAPLYFEASGKFAAECYRQEIETAMRSKNLAGFQLLDLQDFSGQGTALVGVLDAFMESKGTISCVDWRKFCSDTVLLGEFEKYTYQANEVFNACIKLSHYNPVPLTSKTLSWKLSTDCLTLVEGKLNIPDNSYELVELGNITYTLPKVISPTNIYFTLQLDDTIHMNAYTLMVYPQITINLNKIVELNRHKLHIVNSFQEAEPLLGDGKRVLLLPSEVKASIPGFYCTDFWCYPMFRSISESMNQPVPIGTMGLLIDNNHKSLADFPSEIYSTPQWYQIVSHASCEILDHTPHEFRPIVQMIDNFERNHKLGILYEANVLNGKLLVCTARLSEILEYPEVQSFTKSIINYALSDDFAPTYFLDVSYFK